MAITVARHVESVTGSGVASAVVTRQGVVESHRICRREWSRIVAVTTAYQGVQTCRLKFGWSLWLESETKSSSCGSSDKVWLP